MVYWFTHNAGKTFVVLLNQNENNFHIFKISRENVHGLLQIHENCKSFVIYDTGHRNQPSNFLAIKS